MVGWVLRWRWQLLLTEKTLHSCFKSNLKLKRKGGGKALLIGEYAAKRLGVKQKTHPG